ncbi:hypothetical protein ACFS2C_04835 [Prauserella oleivorans]|uniref:MFS transporter n=1 Tax=Prauserella oleivorans TaxID=1478153 RepID=A0ABW5W887_9PSEU
MAGTSSAPEETRPRGRRLRRWSELSAGERRLFVPQLVIQFVVRAAVFFLALDFAVAAGAVPGFSAAT